MLAFVVVVALVVVVVLVLTVLVGRIASLVRFENVDRILLLGGRR